MPIANCFIKNKQIKPEDLQELIIKWSEEIQVDVKDICFTVVTDFLQAGQQYEILVNLYLPSLWSENDVTTIQKGLMRVLTTFFKLKPSEIFILTSIIQSGHVVENGEIVEWN